MVVTPRNYYSVRDSILHWVCGYVKGASVCHAQQAVDRDTVRPHCVVSV